MMRRNEIMRKDNLMKKFEVKLHGTNFYFNLDGELKKFGFYATKFVEAENPQEAKKIAVILSYQNPNLKSAVLNQDVFRPSINLEEIKEVNFLKFFTKKSATDFTFYPVDEDHIPTELIERI
jgi:hypothetical protein